MRKKILNYTLPLLVTMLLVAVFIVACSGKDACERDEDCKGEATCQLGEGGAKVCKAVEPKKDGNICTADQECSSNKCIINSGQSQGVCSATCQNKNDCLASSEDSSRASCLLSAQGGNAGMCVATCLQDGDCKEGMHCTGNPGKKYCDVKLTTSDHSFNHKMTCYQKESFKDINELRPQLGGALDFYLKRNFEYYVEAEFELPKDVKSFYIYGKFGKPGFDRGAVPVIRPVLLENSDGKVLDWAKLGISTGMNPGLLGGELGIMLPMTSDGEDTKDFIKPGRLKVTFIYKLLPGDELSLCLLDYPKSTIGNTLDINLYVVGAKDINGSEITEESIKTNEQIRKGIDKLKQIYQSANLNIGKIRYFFPKKDVVDKFRILRHSQSAPGTFIIDQLHPLFSTSQPPGQSLDEQLSVNVFLVEGIFDIKSGDDSGILGQAANIPGVPGVHGSVISGVVLTSFLLSDRVGKYVDLITGKEVDLIDQFSQSFAHELAHFLGLFHTSELSGTKFDPLGDTEECDGTIMQRSVQTGIFTPMAACHDFNNLMFPMAGVDHIQISQAQERIIKYHPLIK